MLASRSLSKTSIALLAFERTLSLRRAGLRAGVRYCRAGPQGRHRQEHVLRLVQGVPRCQQATGGDLEGGQWACCCDRVMIVDATLLDPRDGFGSSEELFAPRRLSLDTRLQEGDPCRLRNRQRPQWELSQDGADDQRKCERFASQIKSNKIKSDALPYRTSFAERVMFVPD
jgi:hypothetical protein